MEATYFVAQWQNSNNIWSESIGADGQQAHYAEEAGIADPLSKEAAREFARVLAESGSYAGRVRVLRRTEVAI